MDPEAGDEPADWRPIHTGLVVLRLSMIAFGIAGAMAIAANALTLVFEAANASSSWSAHDSRPLLERSVGGPPLAGAYSRPYSIDGNGGAAVGLAALGLLLFAYVALLLVLFLIWRVLRLVGEVFLVAGPDVGGVRGPAIGLLATEAISLCSCGSIFAVQFTADLALTLTLALVGVLYLVEFANTVLLLMFLWQLSKARHSDRVRRAVSTYSMWLVTSIGVGIIEVLGVVAVAFGLAATGPASNRSLVGVMLLVRGTVFLINVFLGVNLFFRLFGLLEEARRTVARRGAYARA